MRRVISIITSGLIFLVGYIWHVLDVIGRSDVFMKLPDFVDGFQHFLIAHQEIGYQIAPWVLMVVSVVFLAFLQWPELSFWRKNGAKNKQALVALSEERETITSPSIPEFISLKEAATRLYESGSKVNGLALARFAERLGNLNAGASPNERLDWLAAFIVQKAVAIYGKKPPSRELKQIDDAELRHATFGDGATILRDNFYSASIFWNDLCVKTVDLSQLILRLTNDPDEEYSKAFNKATLLSGTRDDAKLLLAQLRSEGTKIRNVPFTVVSMVDAELDTWIASIGQWSTDAIEALRFFDLAQAEWFSTLNEVQPSKVGIPNIQLGGKAQRDRYVASFQQHDDRLRRFEKLCLSFGVGVDYRS